MRFTAQVIEINIAATTLGSNLNRLIGAAAASMGQFIGQNELEEERKEAWEDGCRLLIGRFDGESARNASCWRAFSGLCGRIKPESLTTFGRLPRFGTEKLILSHQSQPVSDKTHQIDCCAM